MTDDLVADLTRQLREIMVAAEQKERIIEGLKAASDERLRLIERLDAELRQLRVQVEDKERALEASHRERTELDSAARERLAIIEHMRSELETCRAQVRTAGFVARVGLRVIEATQADHDGVHRQEGEFERQSVEPG
jgi:chromosome segregation ATPase